MRLLPFAALLQKFNPTNEPQNFSGVNTRNNPEVVLFQNLKNIPE
jgi:hypothetical protein